MLYFLYKYVGEKSGLNGQPALTDLPERVVSWKKSSAPRCSKVNPGYGVKSWKVARVAFVKQRHQWVHREVRPRIQRRGPPLAGIVDRLGEPESPNFVDLYDADVVKGDTAQHEHSRGRERDSRHRIEFRGTVAQERPPRIAKAGERTPRRHLRRSRATRPFSGQRRARPQRRPGGLAS